MPHVVALDFGMKWNIPRYLYDMGCRVTILPGTATADDVLAQQPDGVFLSNGPGDPEPLVYAQQTGTTWIGLLPPRDTTGHSLPFSVIPANRLLGKAAG